MKAIVESVSAKPVLLTATGSAGGFFAWFVAHAEHLVLMFQLVGGFFGCLLAAVSFILATPRACRFVRRWFRRGFLRADIER